ncbi:hypothetical protein VC33_07525 [Pseudomonas fluorescens]|nr:hypothetical protein VC33_07525 [Pseudomonas fluorescens]
MEFILSVDFQVRQFQLFVRTDFYFIEFNFRAAGRVLIVSQRMQGYCSQRQSCQDLGYHRIDGSQKVYVFPWYLRGRCFKRNIT